MTKWVSGRPVSLDHAGPQSISFVPLDARWLDRSPIVRFDHMVELYADHLAVDDGSKRLAYHELQRAAQALSHMLDSQAPPHAPILAVFRYTALFPAALLASIAAGRPIIPIDATYPLARQKMIFDNSGAQVALVEKDIPLELDLGDLQVIEADLDALLGAPKSSWCASDYDPDRMGGVTFTSGSTGNPKGYAWSFGAFMRIVGEMTDTHHLNHNDKIIALGSLASAGLGDALFALLNGASLRVIEIMSAGIGELLRVLEDERITILSFVPAILRSVLAMDGAEKAFRHLRILDLYGDATLVSDIAFFRTKLPQTCHIRLVLGTIEVGNIFHWFVPRDLETKDASLPCGYLAANKSIRVLDDQGDTVPYGEEGTLVVSGRHIALGSWQAGRLTQGPFLPDPDDPRARIYAVGDRVILREDGLCEFRGRQDRMVKVRGQRTDLGEIEAAIRQHPAIGDVAVVAITIEDDTEVVAYCVPKALETSLNRSELRKIVSGATAPHMVPRQFHFLEAIPRLPNYKADLVKLSQWASNHQAPTAEELSHG